MHNLTLQVLIHLRSTNWDTRIAAGQAVEAIVKNVPEWNPPPRPKQGASKRIIWNYCEVYGCISRFTNPPAEPMGTP